MKELVCILCPRGCHLSVDDDLAVTGNFCPRGVLYARSEATDPRRTVTATCPIDLPTGDVSARSRRVPVRTDGPVPKALVPALAAELNDIRVSLPVKSGDVILKDWRGTGVSVIATRSLESPGK